MDGGIDEYLNNPYQWAVLVVLDYIDIDDKTQHNENNVNKILDEIGAFNYISETFLEEGLEKPSREKLIQAVIQSLKD